MTKRKLQKWPQLTHEQKRELLALREAGERPVNIARRLNLPLRCVYHWTIDASIPRGEKRPRIKRVPNLHPLVNRLHYEIIHGPPLWLVALNAEFSPQTLSRWFRGYQSPRLREIKKVLDILGLDIQWTLTPKQLSPSSTQPAAQSSSNLSQANGQSSTQHANS